jgi:hypothetical protein
MTIARKGLARTPAPTVDLSIPQQKTKDEENSEERKYYDNEQYWKDHFPELAGGHLLHLERLFLVSEGLLIAVDALLLQIPHLLKKLYDLVGLFVIHAG